MLLLNPIPWDIIHININGGWLVMNITDAINKLHTDYQNADNIVNCSIKYSFDYHGSNTSIYYTQENQLGNYIMLIICVNNNYYLTSLYFSEYNGLYEISPYIPKEIYPLISPYIFKQDNYSPVKYFEKICESILNSYPITSNYKTDINKHKLHIYQNNQDCPFFECFVRVNMSTNMKKKIRERFNSQLASQIISYCHNIGKTCRFTSDINKAHDIVLAMNE